MGISFPPGVDPAARAEIVSVRRFLGAHVARPGDAALLYGTAAVGTPADIPLVDPDWVAVSDAGSVIRVNGAAASNPQIIGSCPMEWCRSCG